MRSPAKPPQPAQPQQPCCIALYDFDPENPGELGFKVSQAFDFVSSFGSNLSLAGERHHHAGAASGRELVRGKDQRKAGILPSDLRRNQSSITLSYSPIVS
jgi:hypothetical protein